MEDNEKRQSQTSSAQWIAIEPPSNPEQILAKVSSSHPHQQDYIAQGPPSFHDSRFGIILRRQRFRPPDNSGIKQYTALPSRFLNLSSAFEFAGWGAVENLKLVRDDREAGKAALAVAKKERVLGQFTASALAANDILGGIFYTLPAVFAVAGIYSPISLSIATLVLFLWRPVMEELASALPISGAPYTYILNVSTKSFALIGASLLLLDFAATSIVSAVTASAYLAGEVPSLPFPQWVGAAIVLAIFTVISLTGVKESSRIALAVLSLHIVTMITLVIATVVHWSHVGNDQLKSNWHAGRSTATSPSSVIKQIYYGFCLGMLGLTGFECAPAYIARIKEGRYPSVLRNLHIPAILINTVMVLLVLVMIPLEKITNGANVLSELAELVAGRWLRIWIVVDAFVVLCGGVLTGILSACELLEQLAHHRVIPSIFLRLMPKTESPYLCVLCFVGFSTIIFASSGAKLDIISQMFSIVWLLTMSLFPISLLLLKFNRGRLRRNPKTRLLTAMAALVIVPIALAGNIAIDPRTVGYSSAYFLGIVLFFSASQNKIHLLRWIYWAYDQYPTLHRLTITKTWGEKIIRLMTSLRRRPVCILAKTDEINHLFQMILYVRKNEETSLLKIVHFYEQEDGVPSELEANAKILDEAFPETTIDLLLVDGSFTPENLAALAHHLRIPTSLMFMSCPGESFPHTVAEFGARIIAL